MHRDPALVPLRRGQKELLPTQGEAIQESRSQVFRPTDAIVEVSQHFLDHWAQGAGGIFDEVDGGFNARVGQERVADQMIFADLPHHLSEVADPEKLLQPPDFLPVARQRRDGAEKHGDPFGLEPSDAGILQPQRRQTSCHVQSRP